MKKVLALTLGAALSFSLLAACSGGSAETPAPETTTPAETTPAETTPAETAPAGDYGEFTTIEEGKLIMSTNAQFPPYEMVADGEGFNGTGFEGIDIEIAAALADKLGLELVIDDMEFDSALLAVQNNAADMMLAGLSYSEERDQVVDFSDSYATGVQVVIVKEGSDVTMDNLGEYMIGTQRGTTGYLYASDTPENGGYGEDHVIAYDNGATAVQELINGTIDAVIIDQAPAQEYVAANADAGLTILPGNWVEEQYCLAVDDGNTALLNALNTALNELISDGTVQSIIDKYITAE
ncbi:MAG TPA: ABC transporter substrate-binding protein [Candidatus Intestinimonas pullistercoris]|uniref:ABC transporter substrate-binding protein n=2 Tax=Intestinimonas TaxID=1392389 RepID=A0A9D2SY14_9FIRM|nr:ABC transporter substrate-binding protein [uncultured Intestinimonas sp.]HJC39958.1 ABC transporter substrate-binding protein [Candidatus Intestinimonas pullistercoris]